jgi:NIPSNAP
MPDRSTRVVEIRTYRLLPGTQEEYDRLFREDALPLLHRFEVDVVAAGPSLSDPNGYFLIRAFQDVADRYRREEHFYASPEWREGPREAIIEKIEFYTDAVVELDEETIEVLRRSLAR